MQLLQLKNNDIYFNLALEEYLLKNCEQDFFIIWQSENALVVGKHQNVFEEINLAFALENNINIARRISGGGTVYHDLGNINFSFILNTEKGKQIDFEAHSKPIYNFLQSLGLNVNYSKRHGLFIDEKKISGNAEHVYKNRVLHHGTLLFNSDLNSLNSSIKTSNNKYKSKAVKSVNSSVTNISSHISNKNISLFIAELTNHVTKELSIEKEYKLNNVDVNNINELSNKKFISDYWRYNYSPNFLFHNTVKLNEKTFEIKLNIEHGIIKKSFFLINNIENLFLSDIFTSRNYSPKEINLIITENKIGEFIGTKDEELFYAFF